MAGYQPSGLDNPQLDSSGSVGNNQNNMSASSSFLDGYGMSDQLGSLSDTHVSGLTSGLDSMLGGPSGTNNFGTNMVDSNSNQSGNSMGTSMGTSMGMNTGGTSSLLSDMHGESGGNSTDFNFGNLTNDNGLQSQLGNNINTNYGQNDGLGLSNDANLQFPGNNDPGQVSGNMRGTSFGDNNFNQPFRDGGNAQQQNNNNSMFELGAPVQNDFQGYMPGQNSMHGNGMNQMGNMNNAPNQYQRGQRIGGMQPSQNQFPGSNMGGGMGGGMNSLNRMGRGGMGSTNQYQQNNNQPMYGGGGNKRGGGNMRNNYGGGHGARGHHGGHGHGHGRNNNDGHGYGRNNNEDEVHEHKLFIGMIPRSFDESDLFAMFTPFGALQEIHLMRNADGVSKGCAFVKFQQEDAALAAIKTCNNTIPPGSTRCMVVKYADVKAREAQNRINPSMQDNKPGQHVYMGAGGGMYVNPQGNPSGNGMGGHASQMGNGGGMNLNTQMMNPPSYSDVNNSMNFQGNSSMGGNPMGGGGPMGGSMGNNQPNQMSYPSSNVIGNVVGNDLLMQNMDNRFDNKANKNRPSSTGGPMAGFNGNYDSISNNVSSFNGNDMLGYMQAQNNQPNESAYGTVNTANNTVFGSVSVGNGGHSGVAPPRGVSSLLQEAMESDMEIKSRKMRNELTTSTKFQSNNNTQQQPKYPFSTNCLQSPHSSDSTVSSGFSEERDSSLDSNSNRCVMQGEDATRLTEGPPGANLLVYHLPRDLNDANLNTLFAPFGEILSVQVFVDKITNESKGFGFVAYHSPGSAKFAFKTMDGFKVGSKKLAVELKKREDQ